MVVEDNINSEEEQSDLSCDDSIELQDDFFDGPKIREVDDFLQEREPWGFTFDTEKAARPH